MAPFPFFGCGFQNHLSALTPIASRLPPPQADSGLVMMLARDDADGVAHDVFQRGSSERMSRHARKRRCWRRRDGGGTEPIRVVLTSPAIAAKRYCVHVKLWNIV